MPAALLLLAGMAPMSAAAPAPVRFSKQVLPILRKECFPCHTGPAVPAGYIMETAQKLLAGGRHGAAVVPRKSGASMMIRYLTGASQPQMPPGKPLALDTIALIRRWIDEGAKIDSMTFTGPVEPAGVMRGAMPITARPTLAGHGAPSGLPLPAAVLQSAPVTALAYSPDGKLLAAGGYRAVRLLDPSNGAVLRTLTGPIGQVMSVAWSPDGKWLAGAGGLPATFGEVCLWNTSTWAPPRIVHAHDDTITCIAWRPGAPEFATASMDKTVDIWNSTTVSVTRTLKDHADPVFCVAYSPNGKWMASGSADRTVKLYDAATHTRSAVLAGHDDTVLALAFNPKSTLLVTACADKQVRVWPVQAGSIDNPLRDHGEGEAINAVAFSADGTTFVWGAANRRVKIWDGEVKNQKRDLADATDWIYSVAASADGKTVVAGAGDGKVYFWNESGGKLLRAEALGEAALTAVAQASPKR